MMTIVDNEDLICDFWQLQNHDYLFTYPNMGTTYAKETFLKELK